LHDYNIRRRIAKPFLGWYADKHPASALFALRKSAMQCNTKSKVIEDALRDLEAATPKVRVINSALKAERAKLGHACDGLKEMIKTREWKMVAECLRSVFRKLDEG
jgi:hypothetical protein